MFIFVKGLVKGVFVGAARPSVPRGRHGTSFGCGMGCSPRTTAHTVAVAGQGEGLLPPDDLAAESMRLRAHVSTTAVRTLIRSKQRLPPPRSLRAISQTLGLWHDGEMTPQRLRQEIERLPAHAPLTERFDGSLAARGQHHRNPWWSNHKEHWLRWLLEYDPNRSAEYVYNHINCPPMLIWLPEAVGIPEQEVSAAIAAALGIEKWGPQCREIRRLIAWRDIERRLVE